MTRVLVVDDKEENLYYLRALLTGHGFAVEPARHGAEALVLARQHPPDVIISDLLMPVMDGYTLLRHWKTDLRLKQTPFVVYTATYTEAEDEQLALSLGADAFILKPADPDEFLARLRTVLTSVAAAVPAVPRNTVQDEKTLLKVYSETLIRKLEEKTLQLEEANRVLQLDIAERKRMEEKLRESEERFRATFEQAAVGIAHVGVDGHFLRVNDKLCEITGYSRDELLRQTFIDLLVPEERAEGEDARRAMLARVQSVYSAEMRCHRKDGRVFWGSVNTALLRDLAGEPKYFISVIADITERKVLQEQFLRAQRMESIGTLAGGIAHDLNNLLTPIAIGVSLLKVNAPDDGSRKLIDTIERSAQRGTNLVKQVLSFARGVEGARVTVHVSDLVHEIQDFVHSTFPKNILFRTDVPKETWPVHGDPTQLNQVLLNLCVNARDAMPEGGVLCLRSRNVNRDDPETPLPRALPAARYVLLEVTDTGCGIPPEVRARIFEPFFSTKDPGKGTGLGLTAVQSIVRSHGGSILVESAPGQGSCFKVFVPAQPEAPADTAPPPAAEPPARGSNEMILLVDDDAAILSLTKQTLESFGYRTLCAEDGARAIAMYAMHRADIAVVLVDMMMPIMDGGALIKALRHVNPTVSIITTSGIHAAEDSAAATGVKHFLAKPYTADAMLGIIRRVLLASSRHVPT